MAIEAHRWDIIKGAGNHRMLADQCNACWRRGLRLRKKLGSNLLSPLSQHGAESRIQFQVNVVDVAINTSVGISIFSGDAGDLPRWWRCVLLGLAVR
ncbi:MAG: hypothetical protein ACK2UF_08070 [Candidatus Promineifilaceae bacterium]